MKHHDVQIDDEHIRRFCVENRVRRLALFGSILREDFSPDSDVDVLVEFVPEAAVGFLGISRMEQELTRLFGRQSEIHTFSGLHPLFRDEVLREAEVCYEQA